jgi:hypothetical protein
VNSGTFTLDAGSTGSKISAGGTNSGTIQFASTANSSTKLTITGTLNNAGGTISTAHSSTGGITLTGATISGGSITGTGNITVTSSSTLSGVNNSANITFGTSAIKASLSGITNSGTINFVSGTLSGAINNTGGTLQGGNGAVTLSSVNLSGGTYAGGGGTLSSATSSLNTFNGVAVSNATLKVTSGTTTLSGGTGIGSDVSLQLTGGTLSIAGGVTLSSGLSQTAGTLALAGTIHNGNLLNITGGTMSINAAGATISGGSLQDWANTGFTTISGSGTLSLAGVTGTLAGSISNSANISVDAASSMVISGNITTNSGTITSTISTATPTLSSLQFGGGGITGGTLSGNFTGNGGQGLFTLNGVTIAAGTTISNSGTIVQIKGTTTNHGTLNGNDSIGIGLNGGTLSGGTLSGTIYEQAHTTLSGVDFENASIAFQLSTMKGANIMNGGTNLGSLTVSGAGASLTLEGSITNNGPIAAKTGAILTLSGATVTGYSLQGNITVAAGSNNTLSQLETFGGTMTISGGSKTTLSGTGTNFYYSEGNVNVTGANSALWLNGYVANDATMTSSNGGSIVLDNATVIWTAAAGTLSGTIIDAANSINNLDEIELDGVMNLSQGLTAFNGGVSNPMLNNANVSVTGQGEVEFIGWTTNNGTISATGTGLLFLYGGTISGGTVNGNIETAASTANQILGAAGTLGAVTVVGNSTLEYGGSLTNSSTITLGDDTAVGLLTIDSNFTQLGTGAFDVEAGSEMDINGTATLGGTLDFILPPGFAPAPGTEWEVLSASGGVTGTFDTLTLPSGYTIDYEANAVDVIFDSITNNDSAPEPAAWTLAALGALLLVAGKWGKALRWNAAKIKRR